MTAPGGRRRDLIAPRAVAAQMEGVPINTSRAADILRVSPAEMKRKARRELIPSVVDEFGRYWFDEQVMYRIAKERAAIQEPVKQDLPGKVPFFGRGQKVGFTPDKLDGKTSAKIFKNLRDGKTVHEIVIENEIHPLIAAEGLKHFVATCEDVLLKKSHLESLSTALGLPGVMQGPDDVVQQVVNRLNAMRCSVCEKSSTNVQCSSCVSAALATRELKVTS